MLPENHTDKIQPIDAGCGRIMRGKIGATMETWLEEENNLYKWQDRLSAKDRRRRIAPTIRFPQSLWIKRGYSYLSAPDLHSDIDITIFMDAPSNPDVSLDDDSTASKVCKITLLQQLVYRGDNDVVCVCETWLNDSVMDCELLYGYSFYRRAREGRVGGGLLFAIKTYLQAFCRLDLEKENT